MQASRVPPSLAYWPLALTLAIGRSEHRHWKAKIESPVKPQAAALPRMARSEGAWVLTCSCAPPISPRVPRRPITTRPSCPP